jgi:putative salt-induced outer membrane protein YdiY
MSSLARRASWILTLALVVQTVLAADPPPAQDAPKALTGSIAAGLSLTSGNSDSKNINLALTLTQIVNTRNVATFNAFYLRGDQSGALIVDRTSFSAKDEYTISPLTYALADARFLSDRFKEIDYLFTPTVGAGHHLIKQADLDLSVEAGVGLALEKDSGRDKTTSPAVQAKQSLTWILSPTATVTEAALTIWRVGRHDALLHVETAVAAGLTTRSQLKLAVFDDYKSNPPTPGVKRNDISLIAAFVVTF